MGTCRQTEMPWTLTQRRREDERARRTKARVMRKGKSSKNENKDATDNQSDRECSHCKTKGHIARHCKQRINDEKAKAGQHRDNCKSNSTNVKQRVAALESSTSKVQAENVSSVPRVVTSPHSTTTCSKKIADGKTRCRNIISTSGMM